MLHRRPVYKVSAYKLENDRYGDMIDDFNQVLEELENIGEDGIFPVTMSRISNEGETYTEINTDMLYILRWGGLLGMLEIPYGLTIELNDRYDALEMKTRLPYILDRVSDGKLQYVGSACSKLGQLVNVYALDNPHYIEKMELWMENYAEDYDLKSHILMLSAAADFKEHTLDEKYNEIVHMSEGALETEGLAENPFEDLYYSMDSNGPEPYMGRSKEDEH